jgi:hypothetical protein
MRAGHSYLIAIIASIAISGSSTALARIITNFTIPGSAAVPVNTAVPNFVNSQSESPNQITIPLNAPALSFNSVDPIDTAFSVQPSSGSTTYFVQESLKNDSGIAWSGFELQIGVGTGLNYQFPNAFIPEENYIDFGGVNYSLAPPPTASTFATRGGIFYRELTWSSGLVPAGGTLNLSFSLLTPGEPIGDPAPNFTLRQYPIGVPEPTGALLSGIGLLIVASFYLGMRI